jgi:hypothetical protein
MRELTHQTDDSFIEINLRPFQARDLAKSHAGAGDSANENGACLDRYPMLECKRIGL